jgi:hypothetical protein
VHRLGYVCSGPSIQKQMPKCDRITIHAILWPDEDANRALLIEPKCFVEEECADEAIEKTRDLPTRENRRSGRCLESNQQLGKIVVTCPRAKRDGERWEGLHKITAHLRILGRRGLLTVGVLPFRLPRAGRVSSHIYSQQRALAQAS